VKTFERKARRARKRLRNPEFSIFRSMTPAQSREARAIAYRAALAVIG
jgi:hypothetical protein